ncbi:MAG: hypothetical protein HQL43_02620 [Alphaproteobacteria bacterium]|nr:hypothetical protein [Alphaproteobacteria bacterium]
MLSMLIVLKGMLEFIGYMLIGQFVVYVMSFGRHEQNPIYRAMRFLTSPIVRLVRYITPKAVIDKHVPVVSFFLTFWAWAVLAYFKHELTQGGSGA